MATLDPVLLEKYAIAANASYANQPVPLGMEFLAASAPSSTGFAASAFRDTTSRMGRMMGRMVGRMLGRMGGWAGWGRAKITDWFDRVKAEYIDGIWP